MKTFYWLESMSTQSSLVEVPQQFLQFLIFFLSPFPFFPSFPKKYCVGVGWGSATGVTESMCGNLTDNLRYRSSPSTLFETRSPCLSPLCQARWLLSFWGFSCLCRNTGTFVIAPSLFVVLVIQTQLLTIA